MTSRPIPAPSGGGDYNLRPSPDALPVPTIIPKGVLIRRLCDVLCDESKGGHHG
jgi:hypothetical protein